ACEAGWPELRRAQRRDRYDRNALPKSSAICPVTVAFVVRLTAANCATATSAKRDRSAAGVEAHLLVGPDLRRPRCCAICCSRCAKNCLRRSPDTPSLGGVKGDPTIAELARRLAYTLVGPAAALCARFHIPVDELEQLARLAYYAELRKGGATQ